MVDGDEVFVTLGSDHTDRALEAVDIVASKGVGPKPGVPPLDGRSRRWGTDGGDLRLSSRIDGGVAYQDGSAAANLPPLELVAGIPWAGPRPGCFVAFTGTVPVIGGIRSSAGFHAELAGLGLEPVELDYRVEAVPGLGG